MAESHNRGKGRGIKLLRELVDHRGHECVPWPMCRLANGYGCIGYLGVLQYPHRMICQMVHGSPGALTMTERLKLPGYWSLRKLGVEPSQWALQFRGMDWIKISDFLPPIDPARSTLDDEMRAFAAVMNDAHGEGPEKTDA